MTKIQNPKPVYDLEVFLVPMLLRGNVYHMGSHAGAWEPGKLPGLFVRCFGH